jgi:hypothetical protein
LFPRGETVQAPADDARTGSWRPAADAGAAGLNLQHASVNMDLPWNPALLEQRIGCIHRMGQKRPAQIDNFVAKGTIDGVFRDLSRPVEVHRHVALSP